MLRNILTDLANALREQGNIDEWESFIDAMFCAAKSGGRGIGKTKRGKGLKIAVLCLAWMATKTPDTMGVSCRELPGFCETRFY